MFDKTKGPRNTLKMPMAGANSGVNKRHSVLQTNVPGVSTGDIQALTKQFDKMVQN